MWLSLIAMMLSVPLMVNKGMAPSMPKLSITPARLPEGGGNLGHPFDVYECAVIVENVADLWAVGFKIQFAPFGKTLVIPKTEIREGDFMSQGDWPTYFTTKVDSFEGVVDVIITRLYQTNPMGASGSGTLITFKVNVVEAGNSPLALFDTTMVDSTLSPMVHNTFDSAFYGATADLVRCNMPEGRNIYVGEPAIFQIRVRNDGDVPLYVRGKLAVERASDGRRIDLYAGQTYYGGYLGAEPPFTELFCDGYYEWVEEWTHYGDSPVLDEVDDGNYVESFVADAWSSMYTFEDLDLPYLGIYEVISNVDFYGYTKCASTGPDIDPYCFTESGGESYSFMWCDSMGGTTDWAWTGLRYYKGTYNFPEYYGFPLNDEAVDNMELLLYNYEGADGEWVDALKARVEFATIIPLLENIEPIVLMPGEEADLTVITWVPVEDHIGEYSAQVTMEYSSEYPESWAHWKNKGDKVVTFNFNVKPAK